MRRKSKRIIILLIFVIAFVQNLLVLLGVERIAGEKWTMTTSMNDSYSKRIADANRFVVISASLDARSDHYLFYLPLVCTSWRRVGIEPIVVLVIAADSDSYVTLNDTISLTLESGDDSVRREFEASLDNLHLKVIEYLTRLEVKIFYMRAYPDYENHLSMMTRLFAPGYMGSEYIPRDDHLVLTTDADLVPIRADYYVMEATEAAVMIWNADCCGRVSHEGREYRQVALSHVAMRKYQWRECVGYPALASDRLARIRLDRESVVGVLGRFFGRNVILSNKELVVGSENWSLDQKFISVQIGEYTRVNNVSVETKKYSGWRLDRYFFSRGPDKGRLVWSSLISNYSNELTDAHMLKSNNDDNYNGAGYVEHIDIIKMLCKHLFSSQPRVVELVEKFIDEFVTIRYEMRPWNLTDQDTPPKPVLRTVTLRNL